MPQISNHPNGRVKAVKNMEESTRPLYIRKVPESVWKLVHINAIESRMRLQTYVVTILQGSEPILTQEKATTKG